MVLAVAFEGAQLKSPLFSGFADFSANASSFGS